MCGIAGEFVLEPDRVIDPDALLPMLAVLAHRGPDDCGYYQDDRRQTMLLHTRLSIVDLSGGRQPIPNEDGTIWVIANGEIYDFQRITRELEARGHRFRTRSDSEVIVHLYEEHGEDFPERLRGEFAIALYDERKQALYLVRDRFGIKPLYYTIVGGSLVFASEMKALFCRPGVTATFDPESLYHLLGTVFQPGATIFKNVKQVEPGCFVRASRSHVRQIRYWDLSFARAEHGPAAQGDAAADDLVEEFRHLLEEAVRLRLHGDVDVGVYLSGGIDSSIIASMMARLAGTPVKAFTIGFEDHKYDETERATQVARKLGLDHRVLRLGAGALAPHFVKSLWHTELPFLNAHGTAKFLLSRLAAADVTVVLTGEGSDEVLAGYGQFKHGLMLDAVHENPADRAARRRLKEFLAADGPLGGITRATSYREYDRVFDLFGSYPYVVLRCLVCQKVLWPLLSKEFRRRVATVDSVAELAGRIDRSMIEGLPAPWPSQYVVFKTDLASYTLNLGGDRTEMANSIEGRLPFLDHKLVEFGCRLPTTLLLRDGREKYILRRAFADVVPESAQPKKKVFLAPTTSALGLDTTGPLVETYLSPRFVREAGIFEPQMLKLLRRALRILPKGSYYHSACEGALVLALSLHVLYDLFCKNFSSSAVSFSHPSRMGRLEARQARVTQES